MMLLHSLLCSSVYGVRNIFKIDLNLCGLKSVKYYCLQLLLENVGKYCRMTLPVDLLISCGFVHPLILSVCPKLISVKVHQNSLNYCPLRSVRGDKFISFGHFFLVNSSLIIREIEWLWLFYNNVNVVL